MSRASNDVAPHVRLAYASAAVLFLSGLFMLVRADETVETVLGIVILLAGASIAAQTWRAQVQRRS